MKQYGVCFKSHELLLICVPYLSVADVKFHHNLLRYYTIHSLLNHTSPCLGCRNIPVAQTTHDSTHSGINSLDSEKDAETAYSETVNQYV